MTEQDCDVDLRLWGKSKHLVRPYPVVWHLVDTSAVAAVLWDDYLSGCQRRLIMEGLAGLSWLVRS